MSLIVFSISAVSACAVCACRANALSSLSALFALCLLLKQDMSHSSEADMSLGWLWETPASDAVDDDKRTETGGSVMKINDMALELVLSFLSITEVYKCRSLCKKWFVSANYVISHCSTLALQ